LPKTTLSLLEAAVVTAICFGLSIFLSLQAVLTGFPDSPFTSSGVVWLIGTELLLGASALLFLRTRGFAIETLFPHPTLRGSLLGLGLFFLAWAAGVLATAPFVSGQAEQPIERMVAESHMPVSFVVAFALVNGTFEEVFLLGVLVRGLRAFGLALALGLPLLVRVLYHLYQGPIGALWVLAFGLIFSVAYVCSPALWPPVIAHVLWDIVPLTSAGA
jgi:uncharacterized protein